MRSIEKTELQIAYELMTDILESAKELEVAKKYDPYHIEITWEHENDKYEICIDVSIKPRGSNGNDRGSRSLN